MATSTRVSGFQPGGNVVLRRSLGPEQQRVLAGPQGSVRREVREPMAALLDSPPEEYQPFQGLPLMTTVTVGIPRYRLHSDKLFANSDSFVACVARCLHS
jgi:hypothetical protein